MLLLKYAEIRMELLSHSLFFIVHVEWTAVFVFLSLKNNNLQLYFYILKAQKSS